MQELDRGEIRGEIWTIHIISIPIYIEMSHSTIHALYFINEA